jgi:hypothetical protein
MRETPDDRGGASELASIATDPVRKERKVATAVVLIPTSQSSQSLQPAAVSALAGLGVTAVAVVGDDRTLGLVVEGWAFDPRRSAGAVTAALAACPGGARTLFPLLEMAVTPAVLRSNGRANRGEAKR